MKGLPSCWFGYHPQAICIPVYSCIPNAWATGEGSPHGLETPPEKLLLDTGEFAQGELSAVPELIRACAHMPRITGLWLRCTDAYQLLC